MPITREDIANMALGVLDEAPIASLEDDHKAARLCKLHFELTREAELARHAWYFALVTAELTGTDTGAGLLNWAYDLPGDCLRIMPLTEAGEAGGVPLAWEQRNGKLHTDRESPLAVRYVANMTEPNDWDPLFTEVLVAALAVKVALPLTHKTGMIEVARAAYERALAAALDANAVQRSGAALSGSWATCRGDTRSWR